MKFNKPMAVCIALSVLLGLSSCGKNTTVPKDQNSQEMTVDPDTQENTEPASTEAPVTTAETTTTSPATTTLAHDEDDVDTISLSFYEAKLSIGESAMPFVTMLPETAPDKSEKWTSSDSNVAKVDDMGNITAVGEGSCTITVTSVSTPDVKEALVKQMSMNRTRERFVLCDATKFSQISCVTFADFSDATVITSGLGDDSQGYRSYNNVIEVND